VLVVRPRSVRFSLSSALHVDQIQRKVSNPQGTPRPVPPPSCSWCVCGSAKVLEEYVKLFDMRDKTFVEALRAFLKEFRLPGEV